jgi:predicted O-methyltransferase YrrM
MSEDYLPVLDRVTDCGPRKGRSVYDGYVRGLGIEHGELRNKVLQDPVYIDAFNRTANRSVLSRDRRINLFLLIKFYLKRLDRGHIIEFGTYRGGSAIFMALAAKKFLPGVKIWGLDSFSGFPEIDSSIDSHTRTQFVDTDVDEVRAYAAKCGLDNVEFVKGRIEDTACDVLKRAGRIALAHIDCDVYSTVKYSWEVVKDYMVPGGYAVFDDATASGCLGATEVIEDILIRQEGLCSEQIYPHFVFRYPPVTDFKSLRA